MLEIRNIAKNFHSATQEIEAIKNISLPIKGGKFISILGPSGCGKSTLLRIIAGLLESSSGNIILDDHKIEGPGCDRGLVFQNTTLFPWLTVKRNISFGLDLHRVQKSEKKKIINYYLSVTKLSEFANLYPKELSVGMQQRVAIARALANKSKILLMDEPFGALDPETRLGMQNFLLELWAREKKTIIFITHDIEEAIYLSDTVVVLTKRPSVVKSIFEVPFAHPRKREIKYSDVFWDMKKAISKALED
jgi:NitT/TauT family transport system ATP-binding protein